jgi:hypothetical protein
MSDEVWNSIKAKVYGHYLAAQNLPTACPECAKILTPMDFGVDPDTNLRLWATHCCGKWTEYDEKIAEPNLLKRNDTP